MGKKLTKKLLVFLTLMCMIIGMNVSVSAETGSTGNTKAISAAENPADGTLQVWLEYEDDNGNSVALSGGSCFLINEEYVLSNYHMGETDLRCVRVSSFEETADHLQRLKTGKRHAEAGRTDHDHRLRNSP